MANPETTAVIVTYHPALDVLGELVNRLRNQVKTILIVDNGSDENIAAWNAAQQHAADHIIALKENAGIAAAQNAGIAWAKQQGASHVLLMDQDSLPAHDMVAELHAALTDKPSAAAAGPRYMDRRQKNPPPFLQIRNWRLFRHSCETSCDVLPVDYLIASGCLIPMPVFDKVGDMRDDLFIDYVDIEWGLRAGHHGFQSYGVCSAHMEHSLGEAPIKFRGRKIPLHSPLRHYYHFRNAVLLYRTGWVPLQWKCVDAWRLLLKYGFYTLYAKPRRQHFMKMTSGLLHGLIGRAGKYK
ncbi:glycosyltransferase family 2 protein [Vreelandella populi]|uniref:Glycosyltransferase family 2 protein n=2 Tax=Vreelandella populi TaxID=2498858 RepID=A0A3S0ZF11_9GAMM|nr:glycosyltransferase family 2 protein [Halomonas populi]RUR46775.1 glycosyltransferase family 2 protein [Halomonas populi]RUR58056.1 glycosyltransferase family 2 protein [Halomonas populi]